MWGFALGGLEDDAANKARMEGKSIMMDIRKCRQIDESNSRLRNADRQTLSYPYIISSFKRKNASKA